MGRKKGGKAPILIDPDAPPPPPDLIAFYAWPPGTEAGDKTGKWQPNSPIILWALDAIDARKKLKPTISDIGDWEIEEIVGGKIHGQENS